MNGATLRGHHNCMQCTQLWHAYARIKGLKQVVRRQYNFSSLPVKCSLNGNTDRSSESKACVNEPQGRTVKVSISTQAPEGKGDSVKVETVPKPQPLKDVSFYGYSSMKTCSATMVEPVGRRRKGTGREQYPSFYITSFLFSSKIFKFLNFTERMSLVMMPIARITANVPSHLLILRVCI